MVGRELYRDIDFKKNLKEYFRLMRPYLGWAILVVVLLSLAQLCNIFTSYLFKIVIDNGNDFVAGTLSKDSFARILFYVAVAFLISVFVRTVSGWFEIHVFQRFENNIVFNLKKKFFEHILHLSHRFHTTHKTGSMISKLNRGTGGFERISEFFIYNVAPLVIQIILVGGSLVWLDKTSALILFIMCVCLTVFGLIVIYYQKKAQVISNQAEDMEKANISDIFTNIESIKYFGKENLIKKLFTRLSGDTREKKIKYRDFGRIFSIGEDTIIGLGTFVLFYFSIIRFVSGEMSIGTLAFIYTVYGGIIWPLNGFIHNIKSFQIGLGDFDSLYQYNTFENEIKDKSGAENIKVTKGEIEFKNVSFSYNDRKIIDNFSLKVNKNEKIAFVGRSGCGKTTLIRLLYRFYNLDSGEIVVDGENINEFKQESLRNELSIVPQECVLFDDTIYNNISFSKPGAKKEEVLAAIKFAQLDEFIENLSLKYNTIVGERGIKLSGGERQRVSIARAILADKKILVLDEATSSLDSHTEKNIQNDLEKLMKNRTSIIIAHRLSTIMGADKIVVMQKGKIVQIGKHNELIRQEGLYKQLWNLQKGGYLK